MTIADVRALIETQGKSRIWIYPTVTGCATCGMHPDLLRIVCDVANANVSSSQHKIIPICDMCH